MKLLMQYLSVAGAGAVGAMARFFVGSICSAMFGRAFPVGTFLINISGSLFLGWFVAVTRSRVQIPDTLWIAVAVGFVGAYTTFSTFMAESDSLIMSGALANAMIYLIGSLAIGLLAVRLGMWRGGG